MIKFSQKSYIKRLFIFFLIFAWIFSGWAPIFLNTRFSSKIKVAEAAPTISVTYLTTGSSWSVPSDWNDNANWVEVIGGGGGGRSIGAANGAGGGGGGAYSMKRNVNLPEGGTITYAIGAGGSAGAPPTNGGDTWFCNSNTAGACDTIGGADVKVGAKGGGGGGTTAAASGGAATSGVGDSRLSGGAGGAGNNTGDSGGGGGGAAGRMGPGLAGGAGGSTALSGGGGGGGGHGGGTAGSVGGNSIGGAGGNNEQNTGAGAAGNGGAGGAGTAAGAGGGGGDQAYSGGNGLAGQDWSSSYGAGSGGGGAGGMTGAGQNGGNASLYGGGGGGGWTGGSGAAGIIVITYVIGTVGTTTYLTSSTSWTVPSNWNDNANWIEVIGGGGGGRSIGSSNGAGGGGGGAYALKFNVNLPEGGTITYAIGGAGAAGAPPSVGGDTWLCNGNTAGTCDTIAGSAVQIGAKGGGLGGTTAIVAGGSRYNSVGTVRRVGGDGGAGNNTGDSGGGGGGAGGIFGPGAIGGNGGASTANGGGGGGGGHGGGMAGANGGKGIGGAGGNNYANTGGGVAGVSQEGGNATAAGAGGGGGATAFSGGAGLAGQEWSASYGSGAGGGGSGAMFMEEQDGISGSLYGAGGGGGWAGGSGAPGIIVINYAPLDVAAPTPNPMTFSSNPANDSASQISMTATTASDAYGSTPIEYLFTSDNSTCGVNAGTGNTSSSWQESVSYSDSGLDANKCYGYTITARDAIPNTGTASGVTTTYTSANVPGVPSLGSPTATTLALTNNANSNPSSNPTTYFAVQVVTTSPNDSNWLNKWVDASNQPVASEVWLTDAQLDALVLGSGGTALVAGTTYGVKVKARNQDNDETALSSEGQGTTSAGVAVSISLNTDGSVSFGTLALEATKDNTVSGVNDVEVVSIDTGPADLDIKSTVFTQGINTWTLDTSNGSKKVKWEFATSTDNWVTFAVPDSNYEMDLNVAESLTRNLYLRLTMPNFTDSYDAYSSTITVTASSP